MSISLDSSIRTCKVSSGEAQRISSDRFLNPNNMVCIPWNGYNNKGQKVCYDSWMTKTRGCNSANDRVEVENSLRPQYADYINLNVAGIAGNIYGNESAHAAAGSANKWQESRNDISGSYGNQWGSNVYQTCGVNAYERAMAQEAQSNRQYASAVNGHNSNNKRGCGV